MPHPEPYPRCIFCGEKANSREHAIPAWVGRRFGIGKEELGLVFRRDVTPWRKQKIRFGSHRERVFCKECNTHFKHLEDEAADLVEWMGRGRPIRLGATEQDVLTRWGAKTAYALVAASSRSMFDTVPLAHRQALRNEGRVHDLCWVAYGSWSGYIHRFVAADPLKGTAKAGVAVPDSYAVVFTFAQLALQVFGIAGAIPGYTLGFDTRSLKQFWPRVHHSIAWPTSPPLRDEHLRDLAELIAFTPS